MYARNIVLESLCCFKDVVEEKFSHFYSGGLRKVDVKE